jgi:hypothetical protein
MTGGIMPKLFAVRWSIALSVMLLLAAGTIGFATSLSGRPANDSAPGDDYAGERQQLLFYKAALGRIDDELRHRGAGATPSLRGERESVLHRMREVASRVPPERLPAEIPALLQPVSAATVAGGSPPKSAQPAPRIEMRELQTGLGIRQADIDFSSLAIDPLPPLPVYIERPTHRVARAHDGDSAGEKAAEHPARERPAKDKDHPTAEKPAKERLPADRASKERPPADRAVAARPPVTVERTAVADSAERSQPAR